MLVVDVHVRARIMDHAHGRGECIHEVRLHLVLIEIDVWLI